MTDTYSPDEAVTPNEDAFPTPAEIFGSDTSPNPPVGGEAETVGEVEDAPVTDADRWPTTVWGDDGEPVGGWIGYTDALGAFIRVPLTHYLRG